MRGSPWVTPFTGVWIEKIRKFTYLLVIQVTPFTGVWIEIYMNIIYKISILVTPFTGVWIEIIYQMTKRKL